VVFDESGPVGPGERSVDLRSLSACFDSTLAAPELVVRAAVRLQGDTATWEARYRGTIRNGALVCGPGTSGPVPNTAEQLFVFPDASALVNGVLILWMPVYAGPSGSQNGQSAYIRFESRVFMLTPFRRPLPPAEPLASSYAAWSFAGSPPTRCVPPATGQPETCVTWSFTLTEETGGWTAEFKDLSATNSLTGGTLWRRSILTLARVGSFVHLASPPATPPSRRWGPGRVRRGRGADRRHARAVSASLDVARSAAAAAAEPAVRRRVIIERRSDASVACLAGSPPGALRSVTWQTPRLMKCYAERAAVVRRGIGSGARSISGRERGELGERGSGCGGYYLVRLITG